MNFEDMYRDYIKSYTGSELVLTEWGFAQYQIVGDEVYVTNIYLTKENRKKDISEDHPFVLTVRQIIKEAQDKGCKLFFNIVEASNPKRERLIQYHQWFGMQFAKTTEDGDVWLYMEI
jgi:hypothetical protein